MLIVVTPFTRPSLVFLIGLTAERLNKNKVFNLTRERDSFKLIDDIATARRNNFAP